MSNQFLNMGSTLLKPFQISLSGIIEKVRCYSACCDGQVIIEDHCEFEQLNYKERQ